MAIEIPAKTKNVVCFPVPKLACADSSLNLAVSVKYTVGESELFNHIPPVLNSTHLVTPGYMQFRAGTTTGNFQAFCPVVK